jgi:TPR repeat protein
MTAGTWAIDVGAAHSRADDQPIGGPTTNTTLDPATNDMRDAKKDRLEIRRLKKQLRVGSSTAGNNIAATYRKLGNARRAFHWWRRTAGLHDGDAWLEVGYCLQYGIGTRRDAAAAIRAYRKAIASDHTTEYGREEAQYHLAVALVDRDAVRSHREVERLLNQAAQDGDYPQATQLLARLAEKQPLRFCRCRRGLARRLGGKTRCPLHRRAVTVPQRGGRGPRGESAPA